MNTSILTIDPGTRYWGVSVFSGGEIILWKVMDLSTKDSPRNRLFQARRVFLSLCSKHAPRILILKKPYAFWTKQSPHLKNVIGEIKRLARKNHMKVIEFSPKDMRTMLCQDEAATKEQLAEAIGQTYPELRDYLNQGQQHKNDYWWRMVGSTALGICYLQLRKRR